jgi:CheY-like chemotaxis protein
MPIRPMHILLVEDDDEHADMVLSSLEESPVPSTVARVANGEDAMLYVGQEGAYIKAQRPDLMLLDLKLPRMDGHEVLKALKAQDRFCTIPVVMLTTSSAAVDIARAYQLHVNSYLTKPADFNQFDAMIKELKTYWCNWNAQPLV